MTPCPSTFYGAQCDRPDGHSGAHESATRVDSRSYCVTWTSEAADTGASA